MKLIRSRRLIEIDSKFLSWARILKIIISERNCQHGEKKKINILKFQPVASTEADPGVGGVEEEETDPLGLLAKSHGLTRQHTP